MRRHTVSQRGRRLSKPQVSTASLFRVQAFPLLDAELKEQVLKRVSGVSC